MTQGGAVGLHPPSMWGHLAGVVTGGMPQEIEVKMNTKIEIDENKEMQNRYLTHAVIMAEDGKNDHCVRAHVHVLADWALRKSLSTYIRCAYYVAIEILKRIWRKPWTQR